MADFWQKLLRCSNIGTCLVLLTCCSITEEAVANVEGDLITLLLDGYNTNARPVHNGTERLSVNTMFFPYAIILNEVDQTIRMQLYSATMWTDYRLSWNSSEYSDVTNLVMDLKEVWKPRAMAQQQTFSTKDDVAIIVEPSGMVTRYQIWDVGMPCLLDIANYPFDNQTCTIDFIVMDPQVDFGLIGLELEYLRKDPIWTYTAITAERLPPADIVNYIVSITVNLQRKKLYHWVVSILPTLMVDLLCCFGVLLPVESGEKLGFLVSLMLTLFVFFLLILEGMPPSSDSVALLNIIVLLVIIKMVLVTIYTIIEMYLYYSPHPNPPPTSCMILGRNRVSQVHLRPESEDSPKKEVQENTRERCRDDYAEEWKELIRSSQKVAFCICITINVSLLLVLIVRSLA